MEQARAQTQRAEAESRAGPRADLVSLDDVSHAVVELETTGFGSKDRVVEVAVVCLDACLQVEREYVSLVNPKRDMGETPDIHGVTPAMASTAPPFSEVADDVLAHITGRVLVAGDPNTLSGKAMKARELGVPIMEAATFWSILGDT